MGQDISSFASDTGGDYTHPTLLKVSSSRRKGLRNELGQNNCFLNVIIQSIWHLSSFRTLISSASHRHREGTACILCTLQELFTHYEYGDERVLNPDEMRIALGALGASESRFQLGEMDDATEALDVIIQFIHADHIQLQCDLGLSLSPISKAVDPADVVCEPRCISHVLFECNMVDLHKCQVCGASSEPELWKDTLYRIYVSEVELNSANEFDLSKVMQRIASLAPSRACPDTSDERSKPCSGRTFIERWILKLPMVFGVSLVWESDSTTPTQLKCILRIVAQQRLDLRSMFQFGGEAAQSSNICYVFKGMVCFYGRHYVSFFYSSRSQQWYLFDDSKVKAIGSWEAVYNRILKGSYQPTLLFWEKEDLDQLEVQAVAKRLAEMCSHTDGSEKNEDRDVTTCISEEEKRTKSRGISWQNYDVRLTPLNDLSDAGIVLEKDHDSYIVARFEKDYAGNMQPAEALGKIQIGDQVIRINQRDVTGIERLEDVLEVLESSPFPLCLGMRRKIHLDAPSIWTCSTCTLENQRELDICDACGSKRLG